MTKLSDELLPPLINASHNRSTAYHHDAEYHQDVHVLDRCLDVTDKALEAQGIEPSRRRYILGVLLSGIPDENAALARINARAELARQISQS